MIRLLLCLLLPFALLVAPAASAAVPPPDGERLYRERDPAASMFFAQVDTPRGREKLDMHLVVYRTDSRAWAARGYAHALANEREAALADYARAHQHAGDTPMRVRNVHWSEGWARLHLGDLSEAVKLWTRARELHGGDPSWLPSSFALLAELGGERDTALQWYARAAKSEPGTWGAAAGVAHATTRWRPRERMALWTLFRAWQDANKRD